MKVERPRASRLCSDLDFKLSGKKFTQFITVNNCRLYYDYNNKEQTVTTLNIQYEKFTGQKLKLTSGDVQIPLSLPISRLTQTENNRVNLETIINKIQKSQDLEEYRFVDLSKSDQKKFIVEFQHYIKPEQSGSYQCSIMIINERRKRKYKPISVLVTQFHTFNDLIKQVNEIIGQITFPLQIRDQKGTFSARSKMYQTRLSKLSTKFTSFIFEYPRVLSYQCLIHVVMEDQNFQYTYIIKNETTFNEIIDFINEKTKIKTRNFRITNEKKQSLVKNPSQFSKSIIEMGVNEKKIIFRLFSMQNSYFRANTSLITGLGLDNKPIQIRQARQKMEIIGYRTQNQQAEMNKITNYKQKVNIRKCYRVIFINKKDSQLQDKLSGEKSMVSSKSTSKFKLKKLTKNLSFCMSSTSIKSSSVSSDKQMMSASYAFAKKPSQQYKVQQNSLLQPQEQETMLECSGDVLILKVQLWGFEWTCIRQLKIGEQVCGLDQFSQSARYIVHKIEQITLPKPEIFYTFQVLPSHSFAANRIFCHNKDSFKIQTYFVKKNIISKQTIQAYRDNTIFEKFKNKKCKIGDLTLNNNLTFGDYQIQNFRSIFVYEDEVSTVRSYIISEWGESSRQFSACDQSTKNTWKTQYLGLLGGKIVSVNKSLQNINSNQRITNLLIVPKTNLLRLNYNHNICPTFIQYEEEVLLQYNFVQVPEQIRNSLDEVMTEKDIFPIYLYTTDYMYGELNSFLRLKDQNSTDHLKWFTLASSISNAASLLPDYKGTVYRGMYNIDIQTAFNLKSKEKDSFIILQNFTSTSSSFKQAEKFSVSGAVLTMKIRKGKSISQYSNMKSESEILLLPFTYYAINSYNIESSPQLMELQEIPMPETENEKLIFWVDDEPSNNTRIINQLLEGIEVVQVVSTRIMRIILRQFFCLFRMMGKKIIIISDMVRKEDDVWNYTAGLDLIETMYNEYGLSNKAIIFVGDVLKARESILNRGVSSQRCFVTNDIPELIKEVKSEFDNN